MDIDQLSTGLNNVDYYTDGFRNMLEDHYSYIKLLPSTKAVAIDGYLAVRYEYDFFGLMQEESVPTELHWFTMRLSGLRSPDEMTSTMQAYYLPNPDVIRQLYSIYNTTIGLS